MPTPRFSPWLRLVIFGVGAAIASVAFGFVVIIALNFSVALAGRAPTDVQNGLGDYALWINALAYPTLWMWLVFCRRTYDRRPVRALGLRAQNRGRALAGGAIAGAFAVAWLFGILWLSGGVVFNGIAPEVSTLNPLVSAGQLLLYAILFVAVGLMEEAMFRGYALHNISAAVGLRAAIWLQAIVFALIHLGNVGASGAATSAQWMDAMRAMPSLALIGAIFALCWAKSGTLWYSIGFHAAWNFALGCVFSLPVSGLQTFHLLDIAPVGNNWLTGGSFGAEGSVLLWPILAALWLVLRRLPDHPQALHDLELLTQSTPQVLAAPDNVMETSENKSDPPRRSRFQTSMRAAREADEANSGDVPILGQLPSADEVPKPTTTVTDFSHDWTPLAPTIPDSAPVETSSPSNQDFHFQPLPVTPPRDTKIARDDEVTAADEAEIEVAPSTIEASKIETAATETPLTETSAIPTSALEAPAPEVPVSEAPVRRRPSPRW